MKQKTDCTRFWTSNNCIRTLNDVESVCFLHLFEKLPIMMTNANTSKFGGPLSLVGRCEKITVLAVGK